MAILKPLHPDAFPSGAGGPTKTQATGQAQKGNAGTGTGVATTAPPPTSPPPPGGSGSGGGFTAPTPSTPPAAPPPMKDIDWFNQDATYRSQAGMEGANLMDALAQILFQRGQGFRQIDNQRRDWGMSRDQASKNTSEDFAARGLLSSGMYRRAIDDLMRNYEVEQGNINTSEQDLIQQMGARDSLAGGIDQSALFDGNYTALADIYGLLGQQGVGVGTAYNNALNKYRAESAQRAGQDIVNTLGW